MKKQVKSSQLNWLALKVSYLKLSQLLAGPCAFQQLTSSANAPHAHQSAHMLAGTFPLARSAWHSHSLAQTCPCIRCRWISFDWHSSTEAHTFVCTEPCRHCFCLCVPTLLTQSATSWQDWGATVSLTQPRTSLRGWIQDFLQLLSVCLHFRGLW